MAALVMQPAVGDDGPTVAFEYGLDRHCNPVVNLLEVVPADVETEPLIAALKRMFFVDLPIHPAFDLPGAVDRYMLDGTRRVEHAFARCVVGPDLVLIRIIRGNVPGIVELDDYDDDELVFSMLMRLASFEITRPGPEA